MNSSNSSCDLKMPKAWIGRPIIDSLRVNGVLIPIYPFNVLFKMRRLFHVNVKTPVYNGSKASDEIGLGVLLAYILGDSHEAVFLQSSLVPLCVIGSDIKGPFYMIVISKTYEDVLKLGMVPIEPENNWRIDGASARYTLINVRYVRDVPVITFGYTPFKSSINQTIALEYPIPVDLVLTFREVDQWNDVYVNLTDELMYLSTNTIKWSESQASRVLPKLNNPMISYCGLLGINLWDLAI